MACTVWYAQKMNMVLINIVHRHTQPFYGSVDFARDNTGEPASEETFTHSHSSWSSIIPIQCTSFTVFFYNLSLSFLWSTSWPGTLHFILHTFLHQIIIFFSQHMPMPSQPVSLKLCNLNLVSLSTLYSELYLVASHHTSILPFSSLTLKCHLIFLSYRPGFTSMHHTTSHTTAVKSPSHWQWYTVSLLVSNCINCLNFFIQFKFCFPQLHQHLILHSNRNQISRKSISQNSTVAIVCCTG